MKFYRKQPIEAEQFDGSEEMIDKYHVRCDTEYMLSDDPLEYSTVPYQMETLEGFLNINAGDWIATGIDGEHWAISDEVFKTTYAELPVIPYYVAEYIDAAKNNQTRLNDPNIAEAIVDVVEYGGGGVELASWIEWNGDTFARAWLDWYTVEEDK